MFTGLKEHERVINRLLTKEQYLAAIDARNNPSVEDSKQKEESADATNSNNENTSDPVPTSSDNLKITSELIGDAEKSCSLEDDKEPDAKRAKLDNETSWLSENF